MVAILANPMRALALGLALAALLLVVWVAVEGLDALGFASLLLRYAHVLGAMTWVGLIVFVNFVQIHAVEKGGDDVRAAVLRWIVPGVAASIRHAAHLTLASGALLLVTTGYLLDQWVFATEIYMPELRKTVLWAGAFGGLVMWTIVQFAIWPNLRIVLGEVPADQAAKAAARERVRSHARVNLVLAPPVVLAMMAAAHGY